MSEVETNLLTPVAEINPVFKGLHNSIPSRRFYFHFKILHNLRKRDQKFATCFNTLLSATQAHTLKYAGGKKLLKGCLNINKLSRAKLTRAPVSKV